jgi:hypothetical protein
LREYAFATFFGVPAMLSDPNIDPQLTKMMIDGVRRRSVVDIEALKEWRDLGEAGKRVVVGR